MLIRAAVEGFKNLLQSKGGLWDVERGIFVPKHFNIIYVLGRPLKNGEIEKKVLLGHNIVTDAGDVWYAQSACGESVTNAFDRLFLSTTTFSPGPSKTTDAGDLASVISGSEKSETAGYPKTNDADPDNSSGAGTDVSTHAFAYTAGDFNDPSIEGVTIAVTGTTWGSGSDPVMTARNETAFSKTSSDTLKVFINHTENGI